MTRTIMEPGERQWLHMDASNYHEYPAVSSGAIRCYITEGPLWYYARYVSRMIAVEPSAEMKVGTAFHRGMEDPDSWEEFYVPIPTTIRDDAIYQALHDEFSGQVKVSKNGTASGPKIPKPGLPLNRQCKFDKEYERRWQMIAAEENKEWLPESDVDKVRQMILSVHDNPACQEYLGSGCWREQACLVGIRDGFEGKALVDWMPPDKTRFADWKTSGCANLQDFLGTPTRKGDWQRRGYNYQLAWYSLVTGINEHDLIFVRNAPPFEAHPIRVTPDMIQNERIEIERHLEFLLQQLSMVTDDCLRDSQGIPHEFHSYLWGATIEPEEAGLTDQGVIYDV